MEQEMYFVDISVILGQSSVSSNDNERATGNRK